MADPVGDQQRVPPASGRSVLREIGGFELIEKVGQGGMGTVWRARQKSLDRIVALKILPPSIAKDKAFIERFVREARAVAKLVHPNVVAGIDVGEDKALGLWYFAMEFVDGPTVRKVLEEQKVIPEKRALEIGRDVARALECARENGIIHRDIKPENILLTKDGQGKLADLGLAKHVEADDEKQTGKAMGTPFYMSPEQAKGETDLDIRSDLYSLGATLFHLVTGQPPFTGDNPKAIMARHIVDAPPLAHKVKPEVSEPCSRLIQRLMQKNREQRFQTPRELAEQIDQFLKGAPRPARGGGIRTTGPRTPIRPTTGPREAIGPRESGRASQKPSPVLYVVGALLVVCLGGGAALLLRKTKPGEENTEVHRGPEKSPDTPKVLVSDGPKTPSEPPRKGPEPKRFEQRWAEAKAYLEQHPEPDAAFAKRLEDLAVRARGTPLEEEVKSAAATVRQNCESAAQAAWQAAEAKATEAVKQGNYDAALQVYAELPAGLAPLLKDKAHAELQELRTECEGKLAAILEKAGKGLTDGDAGGALKELEAAEAVRYAPWVDRVKALKQQLGDEAARQAERKKEQALQGAERLLADYLAKFDGAVMEGPDLAMARLVATEAKAATGLQAVKAHTAAMGEVVEVFEKAQKAEREAIERLVGQSLDLETRNGVEKGKLVKVEEAGLQIEFRMGERGQEAVARKTIRFGDLTEAQRHKLAGSGDPQTPAEKVVAAIRKLGKGREDFAGAGALLAGTAEFALTAHYQERLRALQLGPLEAAAEKAWKAVERAGGEPLKTPAQAQAFLDKIKAFETAHGETQCARDHQADIALYKARVAQSTRVNLVKNGDFESGALAPWTMVEGAAANVAVTAEGAHAGKGCLRLTGVVQLAQPVTVQVGQTYRFTCWVKALSGVGPLRAYVDDPRDQNLSRGRNLRRITEWTCWEVVFAATQPVHKVGLWLGVDGGVALVDDVELVSASGGAPPPQAPAAVAANVPADAIHFGGHAYKVFPEPQTWAQAKAFCEQLGGHLLSIETKEELDFVSKMTPDRIWLGATRKSDGSWVWLNQQPAVLLGPKEITGQPTETVMTLRGRAYYDGMPTQQFSCICEWDGPAGGPQGPPPPKAGGAPPPPPPPPPEPAPNE